MATETKFEQFDTTVGDIESYLEHMEMHFLAMDLKDTQRGRRLYYSVQWETRCIAS